MKEGEQMMKRSDVITRIKNLENQRTRINNRIWGLRMINNPEPAFLSGLLHFINQHKNDSNSASFDKLCNLIKDRLSIKESESSNFNHNTNSNRNNSKKPKNDKIKSKFQSNDKAINRLSKILADTQKQN